MYIEINNLNKEEYEQLKDLFKDRIRAIPSIYAEVCRVEALTTINNLEYGEITDEGLDEVTENIANACEKRVFQEMCEIADEKVSQYYNKKEV